MSHLPYYCVTQYGEDRRREEANEDRLFGAERRPSKRTIKDAICLNCLKPVDWRMDHRKGATSVWAKFEPGTNEDHQCDLADVW